jgi:hypothetical protein
MIQSQFMAEPVPHRGVVNPLRLDVTTAWFRYRLSVRRVGQPPA